MKQDIRVVIPLRWESVKRKTLFEELKKLGYTWSQGDSLDTDKENLHRMAYVAVYINAPVIRFSSNPKLIDKPVSECGYNYIIHDSSSVSDIIKSLKYLQSLSEEDLNTEYRIKGLVESHYRLKDFFMV